MRTDSDCPWPGLKALIHVTSEIMSDTDSVPTTLLKGLLAHFFPLERQRYHPEDIRCFLELANDQMQQMVRLHFMRLYRPHFLMLL